MEIYIYRHALADFSVDHENPSLSPEGQKQAKDVTLHARDNGFNPTRIVSSPLTRAKETAEIARKTLSLDLPIEVDECLYGGTAPSAVYTFLKKFKKSDKIVLVTHQPLIDKLISELIAAEKSKVQMLNGAIAAIEIKTFGKGRGTLLWLASPPAA